jgi:F-type H+-transporting ATPase subunit a
MSSLVPESIEYHVHGIPTILLMSWLVWLVIIITSFLAVHKFSPVPRKIQNIFEYILSYVYSMADTIIGTKEEASKYYPLFIGIFLYVFCSNILGLIPGMISPTSTINTTLALALIVFVYYNYQGIKKQKWGYLKHFFGQIDLKVIPPAMKPAMAVFGYVIIPIIEIISQFARPLSLSVRLFGNIIAKEVLLGILAMLVITFISIQNPFIKIVLTMAPMILRPLIIVLGTLISLIQAGVFLILTMIYIAGAIQHNDA